MPATSPYEPLLRLSFDLGAPLYAWGTAQPVWRRNGALLAEHFPTSPAPRVLDLGTGPGISIIAMRERRPDARFVGLDIARLMLGQAQRRLAAEAVPASLVRADAARLPFGADTFDVVTGHSFLYLLPDPVATLREVRRVLHPDGRAIFMEPRAGRVARSALLRAHWRDGRYLLTMLGWRVTSALEGRYTPERFAGEAAAAGLRVEGAYPLLYGLGLLCVATRNSENAAAAPR